jgi:hypothetical protein
MAERLPRKAKPDYPGDDWQGWDWWHEFKPEPEERKVRRKAEK